ncbi:MAG: hypothetical protein NWE99_08970 [Candidatus Bathyarchaeota archaeon]|nr:hypothetical protein [Candidatus Bathyarchaeota archaeon]
MGGGMHKHWEEREPMEEEAPYAWGYGMRFGGWRDMRCPACGEFIYKPSREELIEMLEHRKKRLELALEHINKEIERLKEQMPEEEHHHEE